MKIIYTFKKIATYIFIIGIFFLLVTPIGCRREDDYYHVEKKIGQFDGSILQYLESQPEGTYDSLLKALERIEGLKDTLDNEKVTLFAITNNSFSLALKNLNDVRSRLSPPQPPIGIADLKLDELDTLLCRYIIKGEYPTDSISPYQDGVTVNDVKFDYEMQIQYMHNSSSGFEDGGSESLVLIDRNNSIFDVFWVGATTNSVDINASNGIIHVLSPSHDFGFGQIVERQNRRSFIEKYQGSPYNEKPFTIPGQIGLHQYDKGGEGIAYHDNDAINSGGAYRLDEGVDIAAADGGEKGYAIGWTNPGEWLNYTVDVRKSGSYLLSIMASSPNDPSSEGSFRLELDGQDITGALDCPNTGGWEDWQEITKNITLEEGRHILRLFELSGQYNLRQISLTMNP